jgi:hypothetical protein
VDILTQKEGEIPMQRSRKLMASITAAVLGAAAASFVLVPGVTAATRAAPTNTSPPTITGTAQEGNKLVGHRGTWTGSPTDYNDFWMRCDKDGGSCANIRGANSISGYVLKSVDVGNTIRLKVQARNADGRTTEVSTPTAVVSAATKPVTPAPTGCPSGTGTVAVGDLAPPARLNVDQTQIQPSTVTFGTRSVSLRFHVTACGGRAVQGALVYATAVPYAQFGIPNEQATGSDGWATLDMSALPGFPATQKQQLLVVFVRARKTGENLLGGVSTRRLVSFHVTRG